MKKRISFILLLVLGIGVISYYFFNRNQKLLNDAVTEETTNNETAVACPFDRDFCAYTLAQTEAMKRGVIISTSTQAGDNSPSTSRMKIDGAGNFSTEAYLDGELASSMVVYAGATYVRDLEDGAWYVMSVSPDQVVNSTDPDLSASTTNPRQAYDLETTAQANKISTEACGELTCDKYELISAAEKVTDEQIYIWIDTKEHLARKMELLSAAGKVVMDYSYEEVTINKPSPLKDVPSITFPGSESSGGAVNGASDSQEEAPSQEELEEMMRNYSLDG